MKPKSLPGIIGAGLVTAAIIIGLALFLGGGGSKDSAAAGAGPVARRYGGLTEIIKALKAQGVTGCSTADAGRTECRQDGRYVAATVLTAENGLSMDTALSSWKSGLSQNLLGDKGPFALLQGPNWLISGPPPVVERVRSSIGGTLIRCDHPFGTCH